MDENDKRIAEMERRLGQVLTKAPITLIKASGDDYSFIESKHDYASTPPIVIGLPINHYEVLHEDGVIQLIQQIYPDQVRKTA